ncbi:unnamed protein product [Ascophyllum nodosum]
MGYFIVKGSSKVLIPRKNNIKNQPILSKDKDGLIRCKFSSQNGEFYDRSHFITFQMHTNGAILFEISLSGEQSFVAPIYILYYIFGKTADKDIFSTILPDFEFSNTKHISMATHFNKAMTFEYTTLKDSLSGDHYFSKFETRDVHTHKEIIRYFDTIIFPHIGMTPESRMEKLNHTGSLIRKMMEVREGGATTDRNSLSSMRVYGPAPGMISSFKSVFNYTVVTNIMNEMSKKLKESPMTNIESVVHSKIERMTVGETMGKILKAGNKPEITIKKDNKIKNRITTNQRDITNRGAEIAVAHSITSDPNSMGGKSNDKIIKQRSVHASEQGVKCIMQSIEVKMQVLLVNEQLALGFPMVSILPI